MYFGRLVSNILVLGLLGGSGYLIYYVADQDTDMKNTSIQVEDEPQELIEKIYERYRASPFFSLFIKETFGSNTHTSTEIRTLWFAKTLF